ncbi:MAG: hypothetical protein ACFFA4_05935 [Promethearchaeota archaeon]
MNRVLKEIRKDDIKFITSEEIKEYCDKLYLNYKTSSDYLISRGYLVNIFEDIYYLKSVEELRRKKIKHSLLELVAKGLTVKRVNNWYYGLYTALNLIQVEHDHQDEFFYVINDQLIKNEPINIFGKNFRFLRFKNALFGFGIVENKVRYSDHEKTILDLIYLWEYNHINENRIVIDISKLLDGISKERILDYSEYYPDSNKKLLIKALNQL